MRSVVLLLILLVVYLSARPQPPATNADVQAALKRARMLTDSLANSQKFKEIFKQGKQVNIDSLEKVGRDFSRNGGAAGSGIPGMRRDTSKLTLPKRDAKSLASLPAKSLSSADLKKYMVEIDKRLTPKLRAAYGTTIVNTDKFSPEQISTASLFALEMGQIDQAVLLSLKAAERDPDDPIILNNTGAVLQKGGLEIAAITVLESALAEDPGNSTAENNLGQSYLTLGDRDKARVYLQQCIATTPQHPLANSSLAMIDMESGNNGSALSHIENSLRGAFTDRAYHLLYQLKKDPVLMDYFKDRYKQPEYFDENKYPLPRQCEKVEDIPILKGDYDAYHDMLDAQIKKFDAEHTAESKLGQEAMMNQVKNFRPGARGYQYERPFMELAAAMLLDRKRTYEKDEADELARSQKLYQAHMKELRAEYDEKTKTSDCGAQIGLANEYMAKMAVETRLYQKTWLRIEKGFFLDMTYWSFFTATDQHLRRASFCQSVAGFLRELRGLSHTTFLNVNRDCGVTDEEKGEADEVDIEAECPFYEGAEVGFGIGKILLNCEKFEFQFGEVIVLNASYNFHSGELIMALGPGVGVNITGPGKHALIQIPQLKKGKLELGVDAGIKGQFFLDFKDGALIDYGAKFSAELDIIGLTKELSIGYTLGANSGLNLEPGLLKDVIDQLVHAPKEESQLNPNVKIYKP
jgi:tetratricopeptide (TPR) repeat protein